VNDGEVALAVFPLPAVTDTVPRSVPPEAQLEAPGPQTEKSTEPVGVPPAALPVTVAVSVTVPAPSAIELVDGVELVLLLSCPTVKHSPVEPSVETS
jgi:hypothetical protein